MQGNNPFTISAKKNPLIFQRHRNWFNKIPTLIRLFFFSQLCQVCRKERKSIRIRTLSSPTIISGNLTLIWNACWSFKINGKTYLSLEITFCLLLLTEISDIKRNEIESNQSRNYPQNCHFRDFVRKSLFGSVDWCKNNDRFLTRSIFTFAVPDEIFGNGLLNCSLFLIQSRYFARYKVTLLADKQL